MLSLRARALLLAPLTLSFALPSLAPDEADEQYHFIARLSAEGHHELVVREAGDFLERHGRHERAPLARYRLGLALFELERDGEAADALRSLAARTGFEFRAEACLRLGQCELRAGEHARAIEALEAARGAGREYVITPATFLLGEAAFQSEDHERARAAYAECLRREPAGEHAAHAARGLAWCERRLGRPREAARLARAFLKERGEHELAHELRFLLADALLESGDAQDALQAFRAVGAGSFAEAGLRGEAYALSALDDRDGAARAFGRLLTSHPQGRFRREAALQRCALLLELGRTEEALQALPAPGARADAELLYWRARALAAGGARERALETLARALAAGPERELLERIHTLRGELLLDLGRLEESAAAFGRSQSDYARHAAAVAHLSAGRATEALAEAERLLRDHPDSPYSAHTRLTAGEACFALEDWTRAAQAFRALLDDQAALASLHARALSRLAWCAHAQGEPASAQPLFERVARDYRAHPEAEEARYMQGRCAEGTGDLGRARAAWQKYLVEHPGGPLLDQVLLGLARIEGEAAHLERLLTEVPDSALADQALFELARLLEADSRYADASARYAELVERYPRSPRAPAARYGLAWCLKEEGESREAGAVLRKLLEGRLEASPRIAALELQVWCAVEAGELALAGSSWRELRRLLGEEARLFPAAQRLARALGAAGRTDAALELLDEFLRGLRQREVATAVLVERAWLALDAGRAEAADAEVRAAARLTQQAATVAEAAFFVGEAHFEAGRHDLAAHMYALAVTAGAAELADRALYKLGFAELRAGRPAAAAGAFERLATEHPRSPLRGESLYLCGEARFRAGDYAAASAPLEAVLAEYPRHEVRPRALFRLGLARLEAGEAEAAQKRLAELARRYPEFAQRAEAELARGRALARLGRGREARAAFARVLASDKGALAARARLGCGELSLAEGDTEAALSDFLKVALLYAHEEEVAHALYLAGHTLELRGDREAALRQYTQLLEQHAGSAHASAARERSSHLSTH